MQSVFSQQQNQDKDIALLSPIDITIGFGTSWNNEPFITMWEDAKTDMLYVMEDIYVAGGVSGTITRIGFNFWNVAGPTMNDFQIKMIHTSLTNLNDGLVSTDWVTVYSTSSYRASGAGWQYFDLSTPFEWNGTDNLLIEICFDNNTAGGSSNVYVTFTSEISVYSVFEDHGVGCSLTNRAGWPALKARPDLALRIDPKLPTPLDNFNLIKPVAGSLVSTKPNDTTNAFFISSLSAPGATYKFVFESLFQLPSNVNVLNCKLKTLDSLLSLAGIAQGETVEVNWDVWAYKHPSVGGADSLKAANGPWNVKFTRELTAPLAPILVSPVNNSFKVALKPLLEWADAVGAASYQVQISIDKFSTFVLDSSNLPISEFRVPDGILNHSTHYYWHVSASNQIGTSAWSDTSEFTTVIMPELLSPVHGSHLPSGTVPTLMWGDMNNVESFRLQLASDSVLNSVLLDTGTITATQYTVPSNVSLPSDWTYWRVKAYFPTDSSEWSSAWKFVIEPTGVSSDENLLPQKFQLEQNCPNPFNPTTVFRYQLPIGSKVTLRIYYLLGQEIKTLVDAWQDAGYKSVEWDASNFASGVYFYRLDATNVSNPSKSFTQVKKMLLLK